MSIKEQSKGMNRLVCMHCLNSRINPTESNDPAETRLIITWSCDQCDNEDDDIQFYSYLMKDITEEKDGILEDATNES